MNQQDPRMRARNLTLWPRPLLTALVAAYTAMSLSAAAAVHTGEDGLEYAVGQSVDRSEWLHGKVEPDVTMAAATQKDVNVAVYVARPAPQARSLDPIEEIKARYRPQFDDIGGQMREIWRGARPSKSMSEEEERDFIKTRGMALSRADEDAVRALQREHDDLRTAMHKEIGRTLEATGAAERDQVANLVARLGGSVHAHIAVTNALAATVPATALDELAKNPLVVTVALDLETQLELDNSTDSAGFDSWHVAADGPFMGGAYDVGLIDTGVQQDHGGFSNVNSFHSNFAGTDSDSHGTHVAGIVANNSTTYVYGGPYPGTATDLDAMIWGRSSNSQATTMARMDDLMTDFAQSPEVVNHSLGYSSTGGVPSGPVSTNDYVSNDSFYDAFVRNYDVQVTKSAGNSGWGANATMTFPANAYNIMVVANMNDRNTLTRGDDVRSTSSSVGPTANGRRKPDISAPGTSIISTNAFWNTGIGSNPTGGCAGNGTDMCTKSGTSMAAPHIAGAIVLQHDGGNIDSQAQKAVLLNTADWWDSNDTSSTADDGQRFAQTCAGGFDPCETPWDRSYGWGYVDMAEALFNRSDYFVDSVVPNNNNAIEDDYELYKGTMFTNEKATLVWEKRADTYVAGGTAGGQRTLSDLNIRLYAGADGRLMDGDFQGNDNVHQVAADEFGTAVIKVYAWSSVFDGASSETFWLATEENFERTNPPSFSATPLIPVVGPFQTFTAPTIVANNGGVPAHNVNVAIANVAGVAGDGTSQNVGTISDGASEQVDFTITTQGLSAGIYNIPVTVTSTSYDETYTGTSITGVQISVETTPPSSTCAALPADTNGNSINIPWSGSDGIFGTGMGSATLYVVTPGGGGYVSTGLTQNGSSGTFNYNFAAGDGPYRFAVRATDNGGNQEAFPVVADCATSVDRVTPESMASAPQFVAAGTIPISWSWTDAAPSSGLDALDIVYAVAPDGAWQDTGFVTDQANGVHNWAPPGPGVYRFATRSEDKAGNSESAPDVSDFDASTVYAGSDSDGDGVLDEDDNCTQVPNADQRDTNGDGYGNLCDADLDNNGIVNPVDLGLFRSVFFTADADADFDGDGVVNAVDLGIIKASFFLPPGPSGVAP